MPWPILANNAEKATSLQTRLPNGPTRRDACQQMTEATSGARVSIQSPHTEAKSLPYRKTNTDTCARLRIAAAATADVRNLDIARTLLQRDAEALAGTRGA